MGRGRRKHKKLASALKPKVMPVVKKQPEKNTPPNDNAMRIKGSPERISRRLMVGMLADKNRVDSDGVDQVLSRHDMKRFVLRTLKEDGKPADSGSVAKKMPVYSIRTQQGYQKVWKMFFTHIRENHGVNDVSKVKTWHVADFLNDIIDRGVALKTFKTYAAAMSKLEPAMNKVRRYPIAYSDTIKSLNIAARGELKHNDPRRAYVDPEASIARIENEMYRLAAYMQLEGGARIAEISELKADRNLRGIRNGFGYIRLTNTKGGRIRLMKISEHVYRRVNDIIKAEGKFEFTRINYARAAGRAFQSRGEKWNGTHGLRWNYAQRRFYELQSDDGKSFQEALKAVSLELGHSRPEITLHYLR
jgi:hypothetical protein